MKFNATVDRIEDGTATLLPTNNERSPITIPESLLPKGTKEGHILNVTLEIDEAATGEARKRVEWLLGELERKSKNSKNRR